MCIELDLSNKFIDLDPPVNMSEGKNQPATTWFSACPRMLPCSLHALWCFAALGWAHSHSQLPSSNDGPQRLQTLQAAAQHTAFQLRTALFFFFSFLFSSFPYITLLTWHFQADGQELLNELPSWSAQWRPAKQVQLPAPSYFCTPDAASSQHATRTDPEQGQHAAYPPCFTGEGCLCLRDFLGWSWKSFCHPHCLAGTVCLLRTGIRDWWYGLKSA